MKPTTLLTASLAVLTVVNVAVGSFNASALSTLKTHKDASIARSDNVSDLIAKASTAQGMDDATVRRIVRDEVSKDPRFVVEALNKYMEDQQKLSAQEADKKVVEMADAIADDKGYPFIGNPTGKIEVFYFYDVNCHYCKSAEPGLRRFVKDNPDVKLVLRNMPILTPTSRTAANVGGYLFATHPEGFEKFHDALLDNKNASNSDDVQAALEAAVGTDVAKDIISKAFDVTRPGIAKDVQETVDRTMDVATKAGITGTPFFFVKGANAFVRGAAPDLYQQLDKAAKELRAKAG